jgi:CubicO group peptidase (beta-lactamase class C family)
MRARTASIASLDVLARLAQPVTALTLTAPSVGQNSVDASAARSVESCAAIDRYLEQQLNRLNVPGAAVAIVEGDQIVYQRGFGQTQTDGAQPTPQTPFGLGSTTKSFTALAVMQLAESGKVNLDVPIQHYLPWFRVADPQASARMTVRQLLNQTSGFSQTSGWPGLADSDNRPGAGERQARELSTLRLTHPVGSAFEYSNVNYNLLGLIVEAVSGESYAAYVRQHIFSPLDMRHSYTTRAEARRNGLAKGHRYWFGFPVAAPDMQTPSGSLPSAQLISSTEDMAHYLIAQLNAGRYGRSQVLSPAGMAEMHRPAAEVKVMGMSMGRYAMGWFVEDRAGTKIIWHDGVVPDFFAYMALVPGQHKGIVLLVNADHFLMQIYGSEVGMGAAMRLAGLQPDPIRLGFVPWLTRGLLIVPAVQLLDVVLTLRRSRRQQHQPRSRPSRRRAWVLHVLLPTSLHLLLMAIPIRIATSSNAGFLSLFAPDLTWLARICGGLSGIGIVMRARLDRAPPAGVDPKP